MDRYPKNPALQEILRFYDPPIKIAVISCIVSAALGIMLSYRFNDWDWFTRSGSLIVVFGLILAKWDLGNIVSDDRLEKTNQTIMKVFNDQGIPQPEAERIEEVKNELRQRLVRFVKPRYSTTELFIVGAGTVIWGFGDLFGALA